jgi:16S rRNA (guanine527-N7)-methyltransferase
VSSPGETSAGARLADLVAAHHLPGTAATAMKALLDLVATDETAPTTVRAPRQAVDVHIADSLTGLEVPAIREAARIADLGAGAGFPGLVLAAALPRARVALVESVGKKCAFMERAIEAAGLPNADVVCARAEDWREGIGTNDVVTARALAPLAVLAEYAAPLLRVGGTLVAWKGARDEAEEGAAAAAAAELGLAEPEIVRVQPRKGMERRTLYLYFKVTETPDRYPRRAGMARKRPLGGSGRP